MLILVQLSLSHPNSFPPDSNIYQPNHLLWRSPNTLTALFFITAPLRHPLQISRIEYIHSRDWVHRDVKPANFVMGTGKNNDFVNIIDFGLAKKFRDPRNGQHIPYKQEDTHSVGTALFASLNAHMGIGGSLFPFVSVYEW